MCLSIILFIYCNFNHIIESSSIISHSGQVHLQNCLSSPASPASIFTICFAAFRVLCYLQAQAWKNLSQLPHGTHTGKA